MTTRIVHLPRADVDELRDQLAEALQARDEPAVDGVLAAGRRRLREALEEELFRLVGELVTEVARQPGLREKVGRAIALGSNFLDALPPQKVLRELDDSDAIVERCRAACSGLITFLAGEVNRGLEADGRPALPPTLALLWVEECVDQLRLAMQRAEVDGIDRRSDLAVWFVGQVGGGVKPGERLGS